MPFFSFSTSYQGVADVFVRDPERYRPVLEFLEHLMIGPSDFSKIQREVLAAAVSAENGCGFCVGAHRATLEALGAEPGLVASVGGAPESIPVDTAFREVLRYVVKLTRAPDRMTAEDVRRVLAAGWSEQALEDAINVAAVFSYVNRLVDAFGIEGNEPYFQRIGAALARHGYAPLLRSRPAREVV